MIVEAAATVIINDDKKDKNKNKNKKKKVALFR